MDLGDWSPSLLPFYEATSITNPAPFVGERDKLTCTECPPNTRCEEENIVGDKGKMWKDGCLLLFIIIVALEAWGKGRATWEVEVAQTIHSRTTNKNQQNPSTLGFRTDAPSKNLSSVRGRNAWLFIRDILKRNALLATHKLCAIRLPLYSCKLRTNFK